MDFVTGKGAYARTLPFQLKRFTLIGATTRAGLLTPPLRDRFGMSYHLDFYSTDELTEVVMRSSEILKLSIDEEGAKEIAGRKGEARVQLKTNLFGISAVQIVWPDEGVSKCISTVAVSPTVT